ncbi:MAG: hypothetical protein EZS28_015829 [Streblomastix strix]|uniref:Uncharacterized protein n=1 Tax=Streblomastix strix TaxID=222440 RepID=A0A5J4W288_9EUKA|nr:MAG: hypothetical protein EZS28_015829 [Streblomastix strix]
MPKKSKKVAKDELYQEIIVNQFPFKSKYDVIHRANYYDIPSHQTKNQFDIYPQTNTLEPHDYQLKPLTKFERPYFSPNYNSWEIDQVFIMKKSIEIKQYLFAINIAIETNDENQSEQVDQQIEKRPVGRPKKYFNDDDRKEAIRKQQLATKRRYAQKKAQIYIGTSLLIITVVETANLFLIASAFDVINGFIKADEKEQPKKDQSDYLSMFN